MMTIGDAFIILMIGGVIHELRLIRKRMGGTLAFFPWNDR